MVGYFAAALTIIAKSRALATLRTSKPLGSAKRAVVIPKLRALLFIAETNAERPPG